MILIPGTDYTVTTRKTEDGEGNTVDAFFLSLTRTGMTVAAKAAEADRTGFEIRVYYDAVIDSDARMGVPIPNRADLEYICGSGIKYHMQSDTSNVSTGGIRMIGKKNAVFRIARDATPAEVTEGKTETLTIDGEERQVVFTAFCTDETLIRKSEEYAVGEDGVIQIYGLAYGTYYIVETQTHRNPNQQPKPIVVQINGNSHTGEISVAQGSDVFSRWEFERLFTGVFDACGVMFLGGALVFGCVSRKETLF